MTLGAPREVAILGFGLIGGSVARALDAYRNDGGGGAGRPRITAWSPSGRGPAAAAAAGIIDRAAPAVGEALNGADLVVIAAPPLETIGLLARMGDELRASLLNSAVVTDVASTKAAIVAAASASGLRFVGGHPMAGLEATGYGASRADLFADRPWVVSEPDPPDQHAVAIVDWLATACRARPVHMEASEHDAAASAISHLPLVAAVALIEAIAGRDGRDADPAWPRARTLAAGGWASATRLARGDARMSAGITATNAAELVADLRRYQTALEAWIAALEAPSGPDAAALEARFAAAAERLVADPNEHA